ncbi:sporulation integral membrane protein YtvI [Bacillus sp. 2205SS5-2]|uniref:sporulation integral membrane protein YtvI n=1 Tax=Bacillus sp. 2205SS5-2 TaxID=3109031 RepID=UPI0030064D84
MTKLFTKKTFFVTVLIVFAVIVLYYILPVSVPLLTASITALLLEPAVNLLQRKTSIKRRLAVLLVFLLFIFFIGLSGFFLATKVIGEGIKLVEDAPIYLNELSNIWVDYGQKFEKASQDFPTEIIDRVQTDIETFLKDLQSNLTQDYLNLEKISAFLSYIPNYLVNFIVYLIALFLFMIDLPRIRESIYSHLTERTADKVSFMTSRLSYVVFGFFKAQFLVSIIIFFVSFIGLLFISPEVALVMSVIIWLVDFVPIIGSIVILGPWSLFHLMTGDIALGTKLAILATLLLIIRRTVEPKVMGSHIGLSPLATLIAMYLGLKLFGVLGFIIGPLILIIFNSSKEAGIIKFNFKI